MTKKTFRLALLFLLGFHLAQAQSIDVLRQGIHRVLQDKSATVGVAIKGPNPKDTISVNGNMQLPMQSVFKFHLALAVLHQVDQGKLDVKESIPISKETMDTYGHLWSPLRKKYPDGAKVPLAEVIQYTVALSDNVGCDLLFERIGGTEWVQSYLHGIGIKDIAIKHVELAMQAQWDRQYENWTTAKAANQVLQSFFENHNAMLSTQSHDFLLDVLKGTKTGKKSIRGLLPENLVVAHKTGHSGKNDAGLTGAVNDIGIVFLPDGSHFYISVLVSNSMESDETNQRIIAEIAKLTWDYFTER